MFLLMVPLLTATLSSLAERGWPRACQGCGLIASMLLVLVSVELLWQWLVAVTDSRLLSVKSLADSVDCVLAAAYGQAL